MRPRIRTIKPELFQHEGLFDLEQETGLPIRAAWVGLFTCCDREGRFPWRPRALKSAILPYDDCDFSRVLDAWATRGFIVKYASATGEFFGYIPTFGTHQVINNRETPSTLPNPAMCEVISTSTRAPRVPDASPTRGQSRKAEGKGREGKGREGVPPAPKDPEPPHPAREWARPYYETWTARFGGQPNVGLLRKTLEPIEAADGRDRTLTRWRSLIAGLNPRFFPNGDPFAANLRKFANAPAAYDDPDWAMSDADRRDLAKLTDGLGLSP